MPAASCSALCCRGAAVARPSKASQRPAAARLMAAGNPAAKAGAYNGPRTVASTALRANRTRSTTPVKGWRTDASSGSRCSRPDQVVRSAGKVFAHAASASHRANSASSAAWLSTEKLLGNTMSGGATPSITMRRTRLGYSRKYSSAARVPYEAPTKFTRSAPNWARTASRSCMASVVVK